MSKIIFQIFTAVLVFATQLDAYVIDAPHNQTNSITCSSCHTYSLWWKYSPSSQDQELGHAAIVNSVCMTCHDGGAASLEKTHSSTEMGITSAYHGGTWGVGCTDCHNPHLQEQLDWRPDSYLIEGVLDETNSTSTTDTSTIVISSLTKQDDVNWPTANWSKLIFALDAASPNNTYNIISATSSEIIVNGQIDLSTLTPDIDPDGPGPLPANSSTANTFGLFYGQLIKSSVASKNVKFFDPAGGFVDENTAAPDFPTGICQVCHVEAIHYGANTSATSDNYLPLAGDTHEGRNGDNCMECHNHTYGFKATGEDHPISLAANQVDCGTSQSCSVCHNDYDQANGTTLGLSNWQTILWEHDTEAVKDGNNACPTCHDSARQEVQDIIAALAGNSTCIDCHADRVTCHVDDHVTPQWVADSVSTCTENCHTTMFSTGRVNIVASDPKVHNSCTSCHSGTEAPVTLIGSASGKSVILGQSAGNTCETCHGTSLFGRGGIHEFTASSHVGQVMATTDGTCETCHAAIAAAAGSTDNGHGGCTTCHHGGTYVLIGSAVNGSGDCKNCHGAAIHEPTPVHDVGVPTVAGLVCADCHESKVTNVGDGHVGLTVKTAANGVAAGTVISCQVCHTSGNSILSTAIANGIATIAIDCSDCHIGGYVHDPVVDHDTAAYEDIPTLETNVSIIGQCATCHDAMGFTNVASGHMGKTIKHVEITGSDGTLDGDQITCNTCHRSSVPAVVNTINNAAKNDLGSQNASCADCHGPRLTPHGGHNATNFAWDGNCATCHDPSGTVVSIVDEIHGDGVNPTCTLCHTVATGGVDTAKQGIDGDATLAAALPDYSTAACSTCHTDYSSSPLIHHSNNGSVVYDPSVCLNCHTNSGADHNKRLIDTNCTTCHTTIVDQASFDTLHDVGSAGCDTCHAYAGTKLTPAIVSAQIQSGAAGANVGCADCHNTDWETIHTGLAAVDHSTVVTASDPNCVSCHDDGTGTISTTAPDAITTPYLAAGEVHAAGCGICHDLNGILISPAPAKAPLLNTTGGNCSACHANYFDNHLHAHTVSVNGNLSEDDTGTPTLCTECHTSMVNWSGIKTGHITCAACHTATRDINPFTPTGTTVPQIIQAGADPTDCFDCHPYKTTFHGSQYINHNVDQTSQVRETASCVTCHTGPETVQDTHKGTCSSCHDFIDQIQYLATWDTRNYVTAIGRGECVFCHTVYGADYANHAFKSHGTLTGTSGSTATTNCIGCHSGDIVDVVHNQTATPNSPCDKCHVDVTGVLRGGTLGTAIGGAGDCLSCHGAFGYFDSHSHGTGSNHYVSSGTDLSDGKACVICHAGQTEDWSSILATHNLLANGGCVTCHNSNRTTNVNAGFVSVKDVIAQGGSSLQISCLDCHADKAAGHVTDHVASGFVTSESLCSTTCHAGDVLNGVHSASGCATCHDQTLAPVTLKGSASGHADQDAGFGSPNVCTTCHDTYFDGHSRDHSNLVQTNVLVTPITNNCVGCHTAADLVNGLHSTSGCSTCHNTSTDGSLVAPAVNGGGECIICHTGEFNAHVHGTAGGSSEHTIELGPADLSQADSEPCSNCHNVQDWDSILLIHTPTVNDGCQLCHNATRDVNPIAPTLTTIQDVIALGVNPTHCLDCHADKAAPNTHLSIDHAALGHIQDTLFCVSCHTANAPMVVHSNKCGNCHTIPPALQDPVNRPLTTEITPDSDCATCHGAYFSGHLHDHASTVGTSPLCSTSCHTGDVIAVVHGNTCDNCHSTVDGSRIAGVNGYGDATVNNGAGGTCATCHMMYFGAHIHDHGSQVTSNSAATPTTANCVGCHTAGDLVSGVHSTNGCASCHDTSTDGALIAPAVSGGGECITCHTGEFNAHVHGTTGGLAEHTIELGPADLSQADSEPCSNCHAVQDWDSILLIHTPTVNDGCQLCHNATRDVNPISPTLTTIQDVIALGANPTHCLDCHADKAAPNTHLSIDHAALGHIQDTPFCVSCHTANAPMVVHSNKCSNCHTIPPALQDPVNRPLTTEITPDSDCATCHGAYFNGHLHDHALTVGTTPLCSTSCHTGDVIAAIHGDICENCHSTVDGSRIAGVNGYGDATVNNGAGGTCATCHAMYFDAHIHDHSSQVTSNSAATPITADCVGCHSAADLVSGVHSVNGCSTCHDTTTAGALIAPAVSGGGECITCHTGEFNAHVHGTAGGSAEHTIELGPADLSQADSEPCSNCHAVQDWDSILLIHTPTVNDGCQLCHNAIRDINPVSSTLTTIQDVIALGANPTHCLDCHGDKAAPNTHLSIDHAALGHIQDTPFCVSCHTANAPMVVHSNKCSNCHTIPPALQDPDARAYATAITPDSDCATCHGAYFGGHVHDHSQTLTPTGLCVACHTGDSVVDVHSNNCDHCHSTIDGSRIAGANGWGDASVNGGAGGSCQSCHLAYFDAHTHVHNTEVMANTLATPASTNCVGCHQEADLVVGIHATNGCATCHDMSTGLLVAPAVAGGGECTICHTTYFDSHIHGTIDGTAVHTTEQGADDLSQVASELCSTCHSVMSWTNILTTHTNGKACGTCHDETRDINPAAPTGTTVQDVIALGANPTNCLDCHADKVAPNAHLGADHSLHLLETPSCVAICHQGTPEEVHQNKCSNCHTSPPTLQDPALRPNVTAIVAGPCAGCHTTYFDTHLHDHSATVTETALCVTCHSGDRVTEVHVSCATCHDPADGSRIVGANGYGDATVNGGNGGSCQTCHPTYFTGHTHVHATEVKTNSLVSPYTEDCTGCHTNPDLLVGIHVNGCSTCHDMVTGLLVASAVAGGGECNTCHATYFDGHEHGTSSGLIVHTVQINTSTDLAMTDSQPCSNCHSVLSWTNIISLHFNDCVTCHNSDRDINPSVATGTTVQDVIATGGTVNCLNCHDDKSAPATHGGAVDHTSSGYGHVTDTPLCVSCHPANDPIGVHNNSCSACHTAPPALQNSEQRSYVSTISRGECIHCHSTYFTSHTHSHAASVAATNLCISCHTGNTVTAVHASCSSCHSPADGSRIVGVNGYGDATVNGGNGGACVDCHSGYFAAHSHDHSLEVMVNYATTPIINDCVSCHTESDLVLGIHSTKGCSTCHSTTTGELIPPAIAGGGQCINCHTTYFTGHDHGNSGGVVNHTTQINLSTDLSQTDYQPCSNCHSVLSWTNIQTLHTSCGICHDATRDVNLFAPTGTTVQDIIRLSTGTVSCLDCHANRAAPGGHGNDHSILGSGLITDVPLCVSCHTANSPIKVHNDNCQACHTATPPDLEAAANRNYVTTIGQGNCTFCHSTYFNSHTHDHAGSISGVALCNNCHSGNAINGLNTHKGNCFNCHSAVNGARIIGANGYGDATVNNGNGGNCSDCHAMYFDGHSHNHGLHVLADPACVTCHNEADLVVGIHDINGCQTCHESATGLLKATLPAGGGTCTDCHGSHDTDLAHNNRAIDFGTGINCSICHTSDSAILGNPGTGTLTSHADIDALHSRLTGDGCSLCHLYDAASQSNSEGLPLQTTVDDAIINGQGSGTTTASCVDCHDYNQVSHPDYVDHVGFGVISWTESCVRCHDNDHANPADVVVDVHKNICSSCHTANIPDLENAANRNYVVAITQGDCETCHGVDYPHGNTSHSKIIFGDDSQGNTECYRCHSSDPLVEHITNRGFVCSVCHQASCYDTIVDDSITNATNVYCTDCHSDQTFPHGDHTHNISGLNNCVTCHNDTNVIEGIHVPGVVSGNNTCDTCHASSDQAVIDAIFAGGGNCGNCHGADYQHAAVGNHAISTLSPCNTCHTATTVTFAEVVDLHRDTCATCHGSNDPTVISVIATGGAADCSSCHGALAVVHHGGSNADVGNCEYCHADPRPNGSWSAATPGDNGTAYGTDMPTQPVCGECHVTFTGTNMEITKFTRTNYVDLSTDWTRTIIHSIPNTAGRINNYGICFSCHDEDTSDNAPTVTVWHARPDINGGATWAQGTRDAGRSPCYTHEANYAAGREYDGSGGNGAGSAGSSNIGGLNIFRTWFYSSSNRPPGNDGSTNCSATRNDHNTVPPATPAFTRITIPDVVGNGDNTGRGTLDVPVFASLVPNGSVGGGGDKVTVTQAYWTEVDAGSGNLVLHATSNSQTAVILSYGGSDFVQVDTHYELTLLDVANPGTVAVTSSGGGSSADTVVVDRTCTTCASGQTGVGKHPDFDNLPITGNCANCHYGKLDAEHRARGIGCTSCHGGAGNTCVPQAITDVINTGISNPDAVNCYSCHGAVDHYAIHDKVSFDDHGVDCTICHEANIVSDHIDLFGWSCENCHNAGTYDAVIANGTAGNSVLCTDCHNAGNGNAYIADHWIWDHVGDGYVRGSANCTTCHAGAVILDVHSTNRCFTCHTGLVDPVTLVGSAIGHAGATPAAPNDCETCHGINPYHDPVDPDLYHDKLTPTPVCTNCHGGGTAAQVPDIDQLDDFAGLANGDRPVFGNWTGVASSEGLIGWTALSGSTASGSTGPAAGNPDPYVYLESSSSGQTYAVGVSAGSQNYIESNVFDASVYSLSFDFDWNMNVNNNTDASLHVDAWNGTSWDLDVPGAAINIGDAGDVWNNSGTIDLASYDNIDFKIRIRYIVGSGTNYRNDIAVDNLHILGIPKVTGLDVYQLHRAGDCTTCHAYDGSGVVDQQVVTSTIAAGISGTRVYCVNCHVDYWFDNHVWNHSGVTGTALCQNCHTGKTTLPVHTDCYSCHDHATAERISGPSGDATLDYGLGAGMGGSCSDCHSAYFDGHIHDHSTDVQANSVVSLPSSNCVNCHNEADRVSGIHTAGCAACHNAADGSLIGSAVSGGGECTTCHTAYFDGHGHVHSIQISGTDLGQPESVPCSDCHAVGTWAEILDTHKKCERCHDSERDVNQSNPTGTTVQWIIENSTSADCLTCHIEKQTPAAHHATDHSAAGVGHILDVPMCVNCHIADNPLANHNDHCSNCHTSPPFLQSASSREYVTVITRGTCETCHTEYFNDHLHDHNATVTSTAFCGSCHTGDLISEIHTGNCDNCHSPVTGALINGPEGRGTALVNSGNGGTCEECHPNYFDAHTHDHSSDVMANTLTTPHRSDCTHCHNDGDPITRMHQVAGCASCHSMTDKSLVGSAAAGGGECVTCHTGYYNAHTHTHTLELGVEDLSQSDYQSCANCHGGADQQINDFTEIKAIHLNDCATCHDAEREVNVSSPNGFTVQLVIDSGSNSSTIHCLTCHEDRAAPAIHQAVDHSEFGTNHLLKETMCSNCHTEADPLDTHNRVCSRCHTAPPYLQDAVNRNYVTAITSGTCSVCHTAYFNAHVHDHSAQVTAAAECVTCHSEADLIMELHEVSGCLTCHDPTSGLLNAGLPAGGGDCNACHTPHNSSVDHNFRSISFGSGTTCSGCHTGDSSVLGDPGAGNLVSQEDVDSLHSRITGDPCTLCHLYDYTTQQNHAGLPSQTTVDDAITQGMSGTTDATCIVCHGYNQTDHPDVDHQALKYVTASANCVSCHSNPDMQVGIHKTNGCYTCHSDTVSPVTLIGSATDQYVPETNVANTCETCHGTYPYHPDQEADHNMMGVTASCLTCHDVSGPPAPPIDQVDDFVGLANGTRPNFGNWTGVASSEGLIGWTALSGATGSGTTGPAAGNPDPYIYLESSASGQNYAVGVTAGSQNYIESNVFDASVYSISFTFDWNMNVNNNTTASLHVDAWNGTAWDLDVSGAAINTGNAGDVWNTSGPIDLSAYQNADFKIRIRYIVGTGTIYQNDVAVDNLVISAVSRVTGPDVFAIHLNNCQMCHAYDGSGNTLPSAVTDSINIGSGPSGLAVECTSCHAGYFNDHAHDHSTTVIATTLCVACHAGDRVTAVHLDCTSCHNTTDGTRIVGVNGYGDATFNGGAGGTCQECHSSYFAAHIHHNNSNEVQANTATTPITDNCIGCHTQGISLDGTGIHVGPQLEGCSACHNQSNGILRYPAVAGGGECVACHAQGFDDHNHAHNISEEAGDVIPAGSAACSTCHAVAAWNDIRDSHYECGVCHNAARFVDESAGSGSTIQDIINNYTTGNVACLTCHVEKGTLATHGNVDHSPAGNNTISDTALCVNCHAGNDPVAAHGNRCSSCHSSPPVLQAGGATVTAMSQGECITCHTAAFGLHSHDHSLSVTETAGCVSCHQEADLIGGVHGMNGCANCHSATTGELVVAANGDATVNFLTGGACDECHAAYFAAHTHDHTSTVKANTATYPPDMPTADCVHCHIEADLISGVHATGCTTCHDTTVGVLSGSAFGNDSGGECVTCHSAGFAVHSNHSHEMREDVTDLGQSDGQPCSNCHGGADRTFLNTIEIKNLHHQDCLLCHDSDRDINPASPTGTTVQDVIAITGRLINCLDCHQDKLTPNAHGYVNHGLSGTQHILDTPFCVNCHLANDPMGVHGSLCSRCHTAPPALQDPANRPLVSEITSNECIGCHTAGFDVHTHDHSTEVALHVDCVTCHNSDPIAVIHGTNGCATCHNQVTGDLEPPAVAGGGTCLACHPAKNTEAEHDMRSISFGNGPTCSMCHTSDFSVLGQPGLGSLVTMADVDSLHSRVTGDDCTLCHLYDADTQSNLQGLPLQATVENAIADGAAGLMDITCAVCHDYNQSAHPIDHITNQFITVSAACIGCHNEPDLVIGVHKTNKCSTCHLGTIAPVTLIGSAAGHRVPQDVAVNTCESCHGVDPYHATDHRQHDMMVPTAGCVASCHDVTGTPAPPINQMDDFAGLANGTRPNFGNWTGVAGSDATNGWVILSGSTASGTTGPAQGNPDPYIYLESSATSQNYGVGVTAGSSQYVESNVIDASVYSVTFAFDWNMNVNNNTDASLHVDAWNGTAWDLDINGAAINTGNNGDIWVSQATIDLSAYTNTDFKVRVRYIVGTGTTYQNDVAIDNLSLNMTARAVAPDIIGLHLNDCQKCHTYGGTGYTPLQDVIDAINNGSSSAVSPTSQDCVSCHSTPRYQADPHTP